jgi:LPS-assembly lipoprotein
MSLARSFLAIGAALALSGCGFSPVYGDHPTAIAGPGVAGVKVAQIPNHLGVVLTNKLRDSFDPTSADVPMKYTLVVKLSNNNNSFATRPDGTAAWTDVTLKADWHLETLAGGKPLTEGTASATAGYSVANDNYANVTSQGADEMRDVDQLADEIRTQVTLYFKTGAKTAIAESADPPQTPTATLFTP